MPARRSHQKSRRGCLQCKQAHVKCKEDGPPCERCKLRGTTCGFTSPSTSNSVNGVHQEVTPVVDNGASGGPSAPTTSIASTVDTEFEESPSLFPESTRLLELKLMHRWSTITFKSMCTPAAGDEYVWRSKVPTWALHYDFLLHGLLALTSFEAASRCTLRSSSRERYVEAATEYQAHALLEFQQYLRRHGNNPDSSTYEPILSFSLTLMVLALASAQFLTDSEVASSDQAVPPSHHNMVQNTIIHYELVRGCGTVLGANVEQYIASNPYIQKLTRFEDLPRLPVDSPRAIAISQLNDLNERRLTSTVAEPYEARVQHVKSFEACKIAIALLQECFSKCSGEDDVDDKGGYQGYILGWLNLAGEEYVDAIKNGDRVAMLVLMLWGAALERLGARVWWGKGFGRLLVREIVGEVEKRKGRDRADVDELMKNLIASAMDIMIKAGAQGS